MIIFEISEKQPWGNEPRMVKIECGDKTLITMRNKFQVDISKVQVKILSTDGPEFALTHEPKENNEKYFLKYVNINKDIK